MKSFVINLISRPERLIEFKKINFPFNVEVYQTEKNENGSLGCIESHLELYKKFEDDINIIFEDDCEQISDFNIFYDAIEELDNDWDMLYLGSLINGELIDVGKKNVRKLNCGWGTHAIAYNGKKVSNFMLNFDPQYILTRRRNIDTFLVHEVQNKNFKTFITNPQIFKQRNGFSDVINSNRDYKDWKH